MKTYLPLMALVLLAGCGGGSSDEEKAPEAVAEVRTATAQLGTSDDTISAYGATEAGPGAERSLAAPAEAIVANIVAPNGTAVGAGQTIVTLRPSAATQGALVKAQADLQAANAALARTERLKADGLASNADVETARNAVISARASITGTGIAGGGVALRAPASGTVQGLTAKVGDQVAAGTVLATIAGKGDLRARFGVDPAIAPRIHPGQTVQITLINGATPVTAPVVGFDPQVDPTTRLASVYVRVPGGMSLSAGEPLRATITVGATANGLTIPYSALLDDGGRSYVFVVRNGAAKEVNVSPGNSAGDRIQILRGLNAGDKVVTEGGTALEDGMKVRETGAGK